MSVTHNIRIIRFLVLVALGLLTCLSSVSNAERLPIKTYTTADGLPHNSINRIVRDSRGFLWFCTGEGLSRFDGYSFINYGVTEGLPHTTVNDIASDAIGRLLDCDKRWALQVQSERDAHKSPGLRD